MNRMDELYMLNSSKDDKKEEYNAKAEELGYDTGIDHELPIPFCDAIAYLRDQDFLTALGIFRITGNIEVVNLLKKAYNNEFEDKNQKRNSRLSILNTTMLLSQQNMTDVSPHDVASMLKAFFQELDEPLLPVNVIRELEINLKKYKKREQKGKVINKVLKELPKMNRKLLCCLLSFLREILNMKHLNRMGGSNISMCWILSLTSTIKTPAKDPLYIINTGAAIFHTLLTTNFKLDMPRLGFVARNTKYLPMDIFNEMQTVSAATIEIFKSKMEEPGFREKHVQSIRLREAQEKELIDEVEEKKKQGFSSTESLDLFELVAPPSVGQATFVPRFHSVKPRHPSGYFGDESGNKLPSLPERPRRETDTETYGFSV
eukprot:snap_masked-scaffold_1-processed-gene-12.16-mRNA-1 protein AED:0.06 eAED:0.06 QI:283/0.66/1/1/0.66/0.5/4/86/373